MTNKIQYSKKFDDGSIFVIGADTVKEFEQAYTDFTNSQVVSDIFRRILGDLPKPAPATKPQQAEQQTAPASPVTDAERVILPDDAVLTVVWNGDKYHGEIEPFPGTKFSVRVWPEVLDNAEGFDKDTTRTIKVGGWEVDYIKNEKGYPQKVVAFV